MNYRVIINKIFLIVSTCCYYLSAYASESIIKKEVAKHLLTSSASAEQTTALGSIMGDAATLQQGLYYIMKKVALFGGIIFLFLSLRTYLNYRKDPEKNKITTIIFLFFLGLVLVLLAIVPF